MVVMGLAMTIRLMTTCTRRMLKIIMLAKNAIFLSTLHNLLHFSGFNRCKQPKALYKIAIIFSTVRVNIGINYCSFIELIGTLSGN